MDAAKASLSRARHYAASFYKQCRDLLGSILRLCLILPAVCCRKLLSLFAPTASFKEVFESRYGQAHPKFFESSIHSARVSAFQHGKLLAVYLHSEGGDQVCSTVFTNSMLIDLLDRNFVLYVEHANGPMMRYLINLLDVRRLPHLSVMIMESEADCSVIARIEDFSNTDAVIQTIIRAAGNPARIPGARFENLEADRQLMDEQDEEYRKAVKADAARMRTQQLREHNDLRRRKQREEVAVMRERIVCDRRAYAQRFSGAQPTGDTKIKVRLPNGSTVSSTFNKDDTVEKVYLWVGAAEYISGSSVQIPYRFDLYLPHPSKMLGDRTQTLESANLFPNATLVLISRDESDDEDV